MTEDKSKVFQCRISPRLYERAVECARFEGISFTEFVRFAIRAACTRSERDMSGIMRERALRRAEAEAAGDGEGGKE